MLLDHKVTLYVPGTVDCNVPAPVEQARWADVTASQFSGWFGGATITDAVGTWVSQEHGLVKESIKTVTGFTDEAGLEHNRQNVMDLAHFLGQEMGQEMVAVEIDGQMELVGQEVAVKLAA